MTIHAGAKTFCASGIIMQVVLPNIQRPPIDVSATVLSQMLRYLAFKNADTRGLLASAGLDPDILNRADERIPIETYLFLEEEAAKMVGDPYFGLHVGEFVEPGSWSILGYLMMNCATLGEAFLKSGKYSRIVGNLITARGGLSRGKIRVVFTVPSYAPKMSRHCFETMLSGSVRMMRSLSGKDISPIRIELAYPCPGSFAEYERIFHCPVIFEQAETSILLDYSILRIPVVHPNAQVLAHFEEYAKNFLKTLDEEDSTVKTVTRLLLSRLDDTNLSIWTVAKELKMSVRTLQNRLAAEGKQFSEIHRETREKLAKKYLKENYSVEDITYLVGFSDPSVFRKAFKKWSGITPKEYRQSGTS